MAERITDIGPPHYSKFLPPVIKDNYGKWKYHQILEPGVLGARLRNRRRDLLRARRLPPARHHRCSPRNCATSPKNSAAATCASPAVTT